MNITKEQLANLVINGTEGNKNCSVSYQIIEFLFPRNEGLDEFSKEYGFRRNLGRMGFPTNLEYFNTDFCRDWYFDGKDERSWKTREEWELNKHNSNTWKL